MIFFSFPADSDCGRIADLCAIFFDDQQRISCCRFRAGFARIFTSYWLTLKIHHTGIRLSPTQNDTTAHFDFTLFRL